MKMSKKLNADTKANLVKIWLREKETTELLHSVEKSIEYNERFSIDTEELEQERDRLLNKLTKNSISMQLMIKREGLYNDAPEQCKTLLGDSYDFARLSYDEEYTEFIDSKA